MGFKGLVVGGSRAGEWLSSDDSSFDVPPTEVDRPGPHSPLRVSYPHLTYTHCVANGFCEFWVPHGEDAAWAIQELIHSYRDANASDAPEEPCLSGTQFMFAAPL